MKSQFSASIQAMQDSHVFQLQALQDKMQADLREERRAEQEANARIREDTRRSLEDLRVQSTVGEVLMGAVGRVSELAAKEEFLEEQRRTEGERVRLEAKLGEERDRAAQLVDKLERLEVVVNEREKLEGQEWARILEGNSFLQGGGGGEEREEIGRPVVVGGGDFPAKK